VKPMFRAFRVLPLFKILI